MKIENIEFKVAEWKHVERVDYPGNVGTAFWQTLEDGNVRTRMVEYSPGYIADHWCSRGHVVLVLEGELITELKDGRRFVLHPGMSYQVADNAEPHRSSSPRGAKLFIVD